MTFEITYYAKDLIKPEDKTVMNFRTEYFISFNNSQAASVKTSDSTYSLETLGKLARSYYLDDLSELILTNYENQSENTRKLTLDEEIKLLNSFGNKI